MANHINIVDKVGKLVADDPLFGVLSLQGDVAELARALNYYADRENWERGKSSEAMADGGAHARTTLVQLMIRQKRRRLALANGD